ncbi:MAG: DUF5060 domain-containing protein [Chloroflexota bacterium]
MKQYIFSGIILCLLVAALFSNVVGANRTEKPSVIQISSAEWFFRGGASYVSGDSGTIQSVGTATDWSSTYWRANPSNISDGKQVSFDFYVDQTNSKTYLTLIANQTDYERIALLESNGNLFVQIKRNSHPTEPIIRQTLLSASVFQPNQWYSARIVLDEQDGFLVQVEQRDNPAIHAEYRAGATVFTPGNSWRFQGWTYRNTTFLENYLVEEAPNAPTPTYTPTGTPAGSEWIFRADGSYVEGSTSMIQNSGTGSDWTATFFRSNPAVIQDGNQVSFDFSVNPKNSKTHLTLLANQADNERIGLFETNSGLFVQIKRDGEATIKHKLLSSSEIAANQWYSATIVLDDTDGFLVQVENRNNPSISAEYRVASGILTTGASWRFQGWTYQHTTFLDNYLVSYWQTLPTPTFTATPENTPTQTPLPTNTPTQTATPTPVADYTGTLLNYMDIAFANPTWSGNPFDLVATVTFTHIDTGEQRETEMFYNDNDEWKARFTAEYTGRWMYSSTSSDPDLDGLSGTIHIDPSDAKGFVIADGTKWSRSGTGEVFVPQFVMLGDLTNFFNDSTQIDNDINLFFNGHGFNGFHVRGYCHLFELGASGNYNATCENINAADADPDLDTFQTLEDIIETTYQNGGVVHLWMYGDNMRQQNATKWGLNGTIDQRMQRYLAARLGPMPGWSMGYGYDVFEWATPAQIETWYNYIQDKSGWDHLLGARGAKNQIMQYTDVLSYAAYEQHHPDQTWYFNAIDFRPTKPAFSEDRFRVDQAFAAKDYTFEETRRGMWHSTMAGGVANIWGNMQFDEGGSYEEGSRAYPNAAELKAYADFVAPRFRADMERCNTLTDGVCLQSTADQLAIIYKENTSSISLDLSWMTNSSIPYTALNTITGDEFSGTFTNQNQTWSAPSNSDWALSIGDYCAVNSGHPNLDCTVPATPTPTHMAIPTETPTLEPAQTPTQPSG